MNDENKLSHLVYGAGLIGGFIAAYLSSKELDVQSVARPAKQSEWQDGITLSDFDEHTIQSPPLRFYNAEQNNPRPFDVIWLTVKCTAVQSTLSELQPFIGANTIIMCCQNGLGSKSLVRDAFPDNTVLAAVVGYNVASPGERRLHRATEGSLVVESHAAINDLICTLDSPIFPTRVADDIVAEQWAKLQLNVTNAVNALADIPVKMMLEDRGYRRIIARLMHELLDVAKAKGLHLPKLTALPPRMIPTLMDKPDWLFKLLGQKMLAIDPTARLSMWWDLDQGKTTEIEFLNLAVAREAKKFGLTAPYNQGIGQLVQQVEQGKLAIGMSARELETALNEQ